MVGCSCRVIKGWEFIAPTKLVVKWLLWPQLLSVTAIVTSLTDVVDQSVVTVAHSVVLVAHSCDCCGSVVVVLLLFGLTQ